MVSQITEGIKIMVETFYQAEESNAIYSDFLFAYRISIENLSEHPVKLLNRRWEIFDSVGFKKEVAGPGVVGEQPVLEPREIYRYVSACQLKSEIGKMTGRYQFQDKYNNRLFDVIIPTFELIVPAKLN